MREIGKEIAMVSERQRLLELALESLENRRKQLDAEIAQITSELRGRRTKRQELPKAAAPSRKRGRFSKDERRRRSQRMKAYWDNWRKQKNKKK